MLDAILGFLHRCWQLRSLRAKLQWPIVGLMLVSLLASTLAFVAGTALTRNSLLEQEISADIQRFTDGIMVRVQDLASAATLLANDPEIYDVIEDTTESESALIALNARAVVIRDRFGLDMIQIYNREGEARTNLMGPSLYRESSLLDQAGTGRPIVRMVDGLMLLLVRADMPDGAGIIVTGIDVNLELRRLVAEYRLTSDLALRMGQGVVATSESLLPETDVESGNHTYEKQSTLVLGDTPVQVLAVLPTTDIEHVTTTGLVVMGVSTVLTTFLLMALSMVITRSIATPIQRLSETAGAVAKGNLNHQVNLGDLSSGLGIGSHNDEIAVLATAFNSMLSDLRELYGDLEAKVAARTRELATAAEVAHAVSSSLDMDIVLRKSVQVVQDRLQFGYVGLFLVEPGASSAVLRVAAGKASRWVQQQDFAVRIGAPTSVGMAARTQKLSVIQDVRAEDNLVSGNLVREMRSAAAVPLLLGDTLVGVLDLQSEQPHAFTPELISLLNTLADQIAIGAQNARLYSSEQQRRQLAELLEVTGRSLSSSLDLGEVPGRVLSLLNALVPYNRGALLLQRGQTLTPLAHCGFPQDTRLQQLRVNIREGDVYECIVRSRSALIIDDVSQESGWQQLPWLPLHKSWIGVPIISKGRVIGMVSLTRREAGAFTPEDGSWVQAFALQAGIALENASLYAEISQLNEQLEQKVQERTEKLDQAYRALEQLDRHKTDFINVSAHELRTPLTVIKGYAQVLRSFLNDRPEMSVFLKGILSGTQRLHEIVNSMLDVAKIDSQAMRMFKTEVGLGNMIRRVLRTFDDALVGRDLEITLVDLDELPHIQADSDLLYKVFYHLVMNAIKYTPDGGTVTISGELNMVEPETLFTEIVIADTGIGIDPEHHELIFEKFYRTGELALHSSGRTKFKGGGPGLGLAIAKGIVEAHGGRIWVDSECNDEKTCPGSQFHVLLPVFEDAVSRLPRLSTGATPERLPTTQPST